MLATGIKCASSIVTLQAPASSALLTVCRGDKKNHSPLNHDQENKARFTHLRRAGYVYHSHGGLLLWEARRAPLPATWVLPASKSTTGGMGWPVNSTAPPPRYFRRSHKGSQAMHPKSDERQTEATTNRVQRSCPRKVDTALPFGSMNPFASLLPFLLLRTLFL